MKSATLLWSDQHIHHLAHVADHPHAQVSAALQHLVHVPGPVQGHTVDVGHYVARLQSSYVGGGILNHPTTLKQCVQNSW